MSSVLVNNSLKLTATIATVGSSPSVFTVHYIKPNNVTGTAAMTWNATTSVWEVTVGVDIVGVWRFQVKGTGTATASSEVAEWTVEPGL